MPKIKQINFIAGVFILAFAAGSDMSFAQNTGANNGADSWVGVVSSETASIRCGANESYYPIATIKSGDLVLVSGKSQDWLKIETTGKVFTDVVGYVKHTADNTSTITISGNRGEILSNTEVLANNIESDELYRSWRPVCRLASGEAVEIISSETTDPGTLHRESYVVHTIKMPNTGNGWVNASNISRATDAQTSLFYGRPEKTTTTTRANKETTPHQVGSETDVVAKSVNKTPTASETSKETVDKELDPLSLVELEARWDVITTEPIMGAELVPLLTMYTELLSESDGDIVVEQVAGGRIKQLIVWERLQSQRFKIENLKEKMELGAGEVDAYQSVVSTYGDYVVVGKLALSKTFDGKLRPLMFRVLDQKSGRTLGYLPVNEDFELSSLLGQIVGVTGENAWNSTWRVNVVSGERFDILSPTTAIVSPDIQ